MALTDKLTAIANAIRGKTGKTDALTLDQIATEIDGLQIGGGEDMLAKRLDGTIIEYSNDTITKIEDYSFYGCRKLKTARFQSADSIGSSAFHNCVSLEEFSAPNVQDTGVYPFYGCALKSVVFPRIIKVGQQCFNSCKSLEFIELGTSCSSIQTGAFINCQSLNTVVIRFYATVCSISSVNVFSNTPIANGTGYVYVPDARVDDYKSATNWSTYANQIRPLSEWEAQQNA